ncbi:unnamed protein product [Protopolystoma xenopodis]|uniref:Uncharacterized protein n=1 Tax=Protopolystoma xenopodis TaxID=117903 RepID=A0A448WPL3_9PLAT|nr:unnamed protein product [Protopolystoma xenopodis]
MALFQRILLCRDVRTAFLETGALLLALPFLGPAGDRPGASHEAEQLRISLLSLLATAARKLELHEMERYMLQMPASSTSFDDKEEDTSDASERGSPAKDSPLRQGAQFKSNLLQGLFIFTNVIMLLK